MITYISLIPNSGIQFWDIDLEVAQLPNLRRRYYEEKQEDLPGPRPQARVRLRDVVENEGRFRIGQNGPEVDEAATYERTTKTALEMFRARWVPLPFFQAARGAAGQSVQRGPTNWVRGRLAEHPSRPAEEALRLTLAFDTSLLPRRADQPYVAPSPEDSESEHEFMFVGNLNDNSWFLDERWVGRWLREMLEEQLVERRGGKTLRSEDLKWSFEHYTRYIIFLEALERMEIMPRVKLIDNISQNLGYKPIAVDLVLDIGNSRSCGILIEQHPDQAQNLTDSYALVLRDLTRPELLYDEPFESRVEFALASFGRDAVARESGRHPSFVWGSPVRVGPEAIRLAGARTGTEGATGVSSPKRYLWDDRPSAQGWRFNGRSADGLTTEPPVTGPFMKFVTEEGSPLRKGSAHQQAFRARFSRSSLFTFMLAEIVLQAMAQINAPAVRMRRRDAAKPRQLRHIILTMPPGMPVSEQKILARRAESAVRIAWAMQGWPEEITPSVKCQLDEATATQIVWLHNEVSERLQGDASALMRMMGRPRKNDDAAPCLRLASVDIGGGTTDLMITTYSLEGEAIIPQQEFRESIKIAGDDVLERIIVELILPPIAEAVGAAGVGDPRAVLVRALGQDQGGQSEQDRHLRRLFVNSVLEPVGLALLAAYEQFGGHQNMQVVRATIADILGGRRKEIERPLRYIEGYAAAAGATGFQLAETSIAVDAKRIETVISSVLAPMLADLCELIWAYESDVLLLSGRISKLRIVPEILLAKMPVPPHRLISMYGYRVGGHYPFRDTANRIPDPKTTTAVGAALCVQAEGRLRNFTLRSRNLQMRSTARYLGRMDNSGQIRKVNELLANVDLDGPPKDDVSFAMRFDTATHIGFRQLPIERWTATPLYMLEFANPENAQRLELPLKLTIRRHESDPENDDPTLREHFQIDEVEDARGESQSRELIRMRLQTLNDQEGYWRDTGRLSIL